MQQPLLFTSNACILCKRKNMPRLLLQMLCSASLREENFSEVVSFQEMFNESQENYKYILCQCYTEEQGHLKALDN